MKKAAILLALLIFLAGCTTSKQKVNVNKEKPVKKESEAVGGGELLKVSFSDFPKEIKAEGEEYFKIILKAEEDLSDVEFYFSLPKFESNCNGKHSLGSLMKGESVNLACKIKAPKENGTYEGFWSTSYSLKEKSTEISVEVGNGGGGEAKSKFENVEGSLSATPAKAKSGEEIKFKLFVKDPNFVENEECWCSIEEAVIKVPIGFKITGLSDWTKFPCGGYTCYKKENVKSIDETFYGSIGVSSPKEFKIEASLRKIWKGSQGKISVSVV